MMNRFPLCMILCVVLAACGGSGGGGAVVGSGQGTLRITLTDAPSPEYREINVDISGVKVHMSANAGTADAGWSELTLPSPLRVNLLSLQGGILQELGLLPLDAGHYQQIRLMVVPNGGPEPPFNNSVVYTSDGADVEMPLTIPTEDTTGIKIVHQFTIEEGKTIDLLLDFDGKQSVIDQGNETFVLKPVIKASVMQPSS